MCKICMSGCVEVSSDSFDGRIELIGSRVATVAPKDHVLKEVADAIGTRVLVTGTYIDEYANTYAM